MTQTLTEFLLARIAEDEGRLDLPDAEVVLNSSGEVSHRGDGWVSRGDCPVCGAYQYDGTEEVTEEAWWEHAETVHQRSRLLAECETKRRIVTMWADPFGQWNAPQADAARAQKDSTLRLLALPYADHPDYDETWRP
ncbi:DUF6221 family protein [Cellulosimicrobium cellulans]|uniref:DUF6221 family protein n=1 Tax=Cellulosimicrobium cellulans TaxID=1710 RepID=UPI003C5B743D